MFTLKFKLFLYSNLNIFLITYCFYIDKNMTAFFQVLCFLDSDHCAPTTCQLQHNNAGYAPCQISFLGNVVLSVTSLHVCERLPLRLKLQTEWLPLEEVHWVFSVCQQAAKMLAILTVLFLYLCSPVCSVFQQLYCTISDSCDCDFKPNIRGKIIT